MTYVIPDPRFEMPALLQPGRKPTGPVKIDRLHWAGRYARYINIFQNGIPLDLVHNEIATVTGGVTPVADYFEFNGTNGRVESAWQETLADGMTFICLFKPTRAIVQTAYRPPLRCPKSFDILWEHAQPNFDGAISARDSGNNLFKCDHNAVLNEWNTVAGVYGDGSLKAYLNGVFQNEDTGPTGLALNAPDDLLQIGWGSDEWQGLIKYVYIFDFGFSQGQLQSLCHDPYQFLVPA